MTKLTAIRETGSRRPPALIAHRGWPARWPENTLEGIAAALRAGATRFEVDIQMSRDGVPVLLHDEDLVRTAGVDVSVFDCTLARLQQYDAGQSDRFGRQYAGTRIPSLAQLVKLLIEWPQVEAFIELKKAALVRSGRRAVLDAVCAAIAPVRHRCILISFDFRVIDMARRRQTCRTGWAIRSLSRRNHDRAQRLAPDYLFFNKRLLPTVDSPLWPGGWQWVVYTVNDPQEAILMMARGIHLIETDTIGDMYAEIANSDMGNADA